MLRELDTDVGQFILQAPAHRPVELAHEGQVAGLFGVQRYGAQALQVRPEQYRPGVFGVFELAPEGFGTRCPCLLPGLFGLLRVAGEVVLVGLGEKIGTALHRQAPGPDQPGQQQTEADLQGGQFPQQGMSAHQACSVSTSR